MLTAFLSKNWLTIVKYSIIIMGLISVFYTVYNLGYDSCKEDWNKSIAQQKDIREKQETALINLSNSIADTSKKLSEQSDKNLTQIILAVKNKPLYSIIDGKCKPSQDFEKAYMDIIREGNKK